jgi:uncharacterized protein (TIGR02246 family)
MFERYTEQARRVIFFARYEASMYGSPQIASEHLLLGLLNDKSGPVPAALRDAGTLESIRADVEARITIGERIPTHVEIPLSEDSRNILQYATDSADQLGHRRVEAVHLLIGILREESCLAATVLLALGLNASEINETAARTRETQAPSPAVAEALYVESYAAEPIDSLPGVAATIDVGRAIRGALDAWKDRNAGSVAEFFDSDALLSDLRGDLWTGRDGIRQGLQKFFAKLPKGSSPGELTDLRSIRGEAWLATVSWTPAKQAKAKKRPGTLRLIAVLNRKEYGWRIVWAHLIKVDAA